MWVMVAPQFECWSIIPLPPALLVVMVAVVGVVVMMAVAAAVARFGFWGFLPHILL